MIERREDYDSMVASWGGYTWEAEEDVQVLALGRTGHTGKVARVVNEYLIPGVGAEGRHRPAEITH